MKKYLVNYRIPARQPNRANEITSLLQGIVKETFPEVADAINEERAEDYEPIYKKLDALGIHILTSCYFVQYKGSAKDLLAHLLDGLSENLRMRIKLLISEVQANAVLYRHPKGK